MFEKIKKKPQQGISNLASECDIIEQQVSESISEILKLVDSINLEIEEELSEMDQPAPKLQEVIEDGQQVKAS